MARLHVLEVDPRIARRWATGRVGGVLGLVALVAALVRAPEAALATLWNVAVPLLPATFFVTPALWRGVCPLSTLNAWGNRLGTPREMTARESLAMGIAGLALFHIIVPARHLGLNTDGPLLAATLVAIAALALGAGAVFASRSAFCNALCPVLPVERLYGQAPLVQLTRGRCDACSVCTPTGCIDLADRKAMRQVLGSERHGPRWLTTPFGFFAAALPGFIVGYGLTPDLDVGAAARVYGATLGGAAISYLAITAVVRAGRLAPLRAVACCGALSGALYYWFTAPVIGRNLGLASPAVPAIRTAALFLITVWTVRTLREDRATA